MHVIKTSPPTHSNTTTVGQSAVLEQPTLGVKGISTAKAFSHR